MATRKRKNLMQWIREGSPWVWLNAGAVSISMIMVVGLLVYIMGKGMVHFWPHEIVEFDYQHADGRISTYVGEVHDHEEVTATRLKDLGETPPEGADIIGRYLIKTGNRDITGLDFTWVLDYRMQAMRSPQELILLERREWGNFYGRIVAVTENGETVASGEAAWNELQARLDRSEELFAAIRDIEKDDIGAINYGLERLRLKQRRLEIDGQLTEAAMQALEAEKLALGEEYEVLVKELEALYSQLDRDAVVMQAMNGVERSIPLGRVVMAARPNAMGLFDKLVFYVAKLWEFISDEPREANTEGGIFPAIFGTISMVFLMTILVTPLGVVAAVYLREYASQGFLTRLVRISVNNLAGVPSIVYGVFGLGFFVYFLGGSIDELFYPEAAPAPVFGSPGLMWASLTLALLTLPVVIVATEEGLARIPKSLREGSLALGATKAETLWRVILPMSSPAIMTGIILAIARAAGEVAPLMLVGVVKLAPTLPLDGNYPFLHLERKFMHMGFHIYDVGFQSPNVEAARPLVYATSF
ncbi:MAG: phosphate ABC transporter permease PstA, partial [Gammaproteobacteria bacterium]